MNMARTQAAQVQRERPKGELPEASAGAEPGTKTARRERDGPLKLRQDSCDLMNPDQSRQTSPVRPPCWSNCRLATVPLVMVRWP